MIDTRAPRPLVSTFLAAAIAALLPACSDGGGGSSTGGGGATSTGGMAGSTSTGGVGGSTSTGGVGGSTSTGGTSTGGVGGAQAYPPGPYGYDVGSTIENYGFVGFPAPLVSTSEAALIHLGDFYNPSGQGTYPAGSPYGAGVAMPRVLLVHVGAVWSGPDNFEADQVLPGQIALFGTCLLPLDLLVDGPTPGKAATIKNASDWVVKYDPPYPVAIDPANQLSPIMPQQAYPTNILIDTQTMTIIEAIVGVPNEPYFQPYVAPYCP